MCTPDKKGFLHPVAFSHCLLCQHQNLFGRLIVSFLPGLVFSWISSLSQFTVQPYKYYRLQKGVYGWKPVVRFKVKWNSRLHEEDLLRKRWQITVLRCPCGQAKFELEQLIMSSCTSMFFCNISIDLLTYVVIKYINSRYFDPTYKLALFLVCGQFR